MKLLTFLMSDPTHYVYLKKIIIDQKVFHWQLLIMQIVKNAEWPILLRGFFDVVRTKACWPWQNNIRVHQIRMPNFSWDWMYLCAESLFKKSLFHQCKFQLHIDIAGDWLNLNAKFNIPYTGFFNVVTNESMLTMAE